jgi:hypothetical protein
MSDFTFPVPLNIYNHCHSHSTDDYVDFLVEVFKRTIKEIGVKIVPSDLEPEERITKLMLADESYVEAIQKFEFKEDEHWLSSQLRWYEQNDFKVDRSNATIQLGMTQQRFKGLIGNLFLRHYTISLRLIKKEIDAEVYSIISQDLQLMNFFWENFACNGAKFSNPIFNYIFDSVPDPTMAYWNEINLNKFVRDMVQVYKQKYKDKF